VSPLQRAIGWGQKAFNEMLFPSGYGGGDGWNYTYLSDGIPRVSGPNIIIPGVSDYTVDAHTSSAVMACINWLCRTFPEAPLQVVKVDDEGGREVQRKHPLPRLLKRPNPFFSGKTLIKATLVDYIMEGDAYWAKIRNAQGMVIQYWWMPESLVEPRWNEKDATEFIGWYDYRPDPSKDRKVRLEASDVVHFRNGINPDNMRKGLSPLRSLIREVYTDEEAAAYSATILKNMGVPGVVISPIPNEMGVDMTAEEAKAVKEALDAKTTGANRGKTIFLSKGVKVDVLAFNPEQMQHKEMRRISEERVTAVLGVPAIVAGLGAGLDRSTFANYAEAREAAYESTIIPMQGDFTNEYDAQLLPDFGNPENLETQFDNSNVRVLQEDENAKAMRWASLLQGGVVTRDEARTALGLPIETEMEQEESGAKSATPILGYHIDSGVVSRNEARRQLGLPAEDESEDLNLRRLQTKLTVMKLAVDAGIPPEEAAGLVNLQVTVEIPPVSPPPAQLPPPEKALEPEFKSYGSAVRAIERRAARATTAYLQEQYEKAAAAGRGWQRALDTGPEARALYNRFYPLILRHSWNDAAAELGTELGFDLENQWVKRVIKRLSEKIVDVSDTTRKEVQGIVEEGLSKGWSIDEIAAAIRELKEVHSTSRARTIARSETAMAYNLGSLAGYREAGVKEVDVFDGDEHEPCRSNNGARWSIEKAEETPLCHPNGTLAFAAVIGED
jgi:HK97 family phage portal protein